MKKLLTTLCLATLAVSAQQTRKPQFEVASVRPSDPEAILNSFVPTLNNVAPGTTLRIVNRQLKELIMIAYNIGGSQLAGPSWLIDPPGAVADIPRFDIQAKVPEDATSAQIPAMLQNLLEDRFKLRAHHEQRQIAIYALQIAKGGMKIKPGPEGDRRQSGCARSLFGANGITTATCQNMTPEQLAQQLQTLSPAYFREGPIVDKTGLTQAYDFTLDWITLQQRDQGEDGPSMLDAVEKLGLHIERQKGAADIFVVDQVEHQPAEN